jgi:hypothetical protein
MTLSAQSAGRILELYEVAQQNGSLISLDELLMLLPEEGTVRELEEIVSSFPSLNSRIELRAGFVVAKDMVEPAIRSEARSRWMAGEYMGTAKRFVPFAMSQELLMIAVSGSTSYKSVSRSKDLDFFCIMQPQTLWPQLTRLLMIARVFRLTHRSSPEICFSCMMDGDHATRMFREERTSIFARDALQTEVLLGDDYFLDLLAKSSWIYPYFPALYSRRVSGRKNKELERRRPSPSSIVLNRFLYATVGFFIRLKGRLLNLKLKRTLRFNEMFELLIGDDHLIYESNRYKKLRDAYGVDSRENGNPLNLP